jgi:hypothetical protein
VHEACLEVGVAFATPTLGALVSPVTAQRPRPRIGSNHLGGCFLAKSLGQLADLGFWVAAVPAQGLQKG